MTGGGRAGFRIKDGVAVVTIDNPPANTLTAKVRSDIADQFARISTHADVKAVVLMGAGDLFSSGADVREIGTSPDAPTLAAICRQIEDCPVPVVAALSGTVMGAAAELAISKRHT